MTTIAMSWGLPTLWPNSRATSGTDSARLPALNAWTSVSGASATAAIWPRKPSHPTPWPNSHERSRATLARPARRARMASMLKHEAEIDQRRRNERQQQRAEQTQLRAMRPRQRRPRGYGHPRPEDGDAARGSGAELEDRRVCPPMGWLASGWADVVGGEVQHLVQMRDPDAPSVPARVDAVIHVRAIEAQEPDHRLLLVVGRVAAPDDDVGP